MPVLKRQYSVTTEKAQSVHTTCEHELVKAPDLTSQLFRGHLAAEHRHNDTAATEPKTSEHSHDVETLHRVGVDGLNNRAYAEHGRAYDERPFPS